MSEPPADVVLVTVRGPDRAVDVALDAGLAVADLLVAMAPVCGADQSQLPPGARWALTDPVRGCILVDNRGLAEQGVLDGDVLDLLVAVVQPVAAGGLPVDLLLPPTARLVNGGVVDLLDPDATAWAAATQPVARTGRLR